jgi:phenylalanyl-tRNA synthetase beta chain
MRISMNWLSDFVEWIETDPQTIADRLTAGMGEIDDVEIQGALLRHCVVGKVTNLRKHPGADKLSLCDVETEQGKKPIVCGGTNLREGMLVALAHTGAQVRHGTELVTLQAAKIRGERSEGMICAAEELELTHRFPPKPEDGARPVMDIGSLGAAVGTPLREALGMTDVIFHVDNHAITNRPDLFSHVGVARELVAHGLAKWKKRKETPTPKFLKAKPAFGVLDETHGLIPFYNACVIEIDAPGTTPDWMRTRLESGGIRSISLPIDITNFVMLEQGMPMHAFDADDFRGDIHVRLSKKGEQLTTLDGATRTLPDGAIIISDDEGIFDLFGIMGGLRTSTTEKTRRIFLQAAIPDPVTVRRAAIALGHRTDAATVYEKGVQICTSVAGLARAAQLFCELCPGGRIASSNVRWGKDQAKKPVKISEERIIRLIGEDVKPKRIREILGDLGFTVKASGKTLSLTPPAWRPDIKLQADIVEEVARVYGYNKIASIVPAANITPPLRDTRLHSLRDALKELRYWELLHLAFSSPQQLTKFSLDASQAVGLENPIGEEVSLMRMSLLPNVVDTAARQLRSTDASVKVYEYGHVYAKGREWSECCIVVAGKRATALEDDPLLTVKADVQYACRVMGYSVETRRKHDILPWMHPGRCAELSCKGKTIGVVAELHPNLCAACDLPARAAAAVIDWDALLALPAGVPVVAPLPLFPAISYDETLPLGTKGDYAAAVGHLKSIDPLLESVSIVNLYQHPEKADDKRITLRFVYRSPERTLQQADTDKLHAKVVAQLKQHLV